MTRQPLSTADREALEGSLALAARLSDAIPPLSAVHVQALYDDLLVGNPDDEAIRATGVAFGELLAAGRPYEWVRVTDEWGSELALGVFGLEVSCHPISMIEHRLDDRELVDIARLVDMTVAEIDAVIAGRPDQRRSDGEESSPQQTLRK